MYCSIAHVVFFQNTNTRLKPVANGWARADMRIFKRQTLRTNRTDQRVYQRTDTASYKSASRRRKREPSKRWTCEDYAKRDLFHIINSLKSDFVSKKSKIWETGQWNK